MLLLVSSKVAVQRMQHVNDYGHGYGFLQAMFSYSKAYVGGEIGEK